MNRQAKRMMQKQKAAPADRAEVTRQRRSAMAERKQRPRTSIRTFLKEVRAELRKVAWPTRQEVIGYTVVVLVAVVFMTAYTFALDLGFSRAILHIFGASG